LKKLINATAAGSLDRVVIMVPALAGLRLGEVLGLQSPAVDLKKNKLHVRTNVIDTGKANGGRGLGAPNR
jgi:site-specific recombinase XerC